MEIKTKTNGISLNVKAFAHKEAINTIGENIFANDATDKG